MATLKDMPSAHRLRPQAVAEVQKVVDANLNASRQYAPQLKHRRLKIIRGEDLHNNKLFESYALKQDYFKKKACKMPNGAIMKVGEVPNTRGLLTAGIDKGNPILDDCDDSINEVYLFLSERNSVVERIVKEGFSIFRQPVYLLESAQVADLIADAWSAGTTEELSMLIVKVILGRTYIHNKPDEELKSLPCLKKGCMTQNCQQHTEKFDSALKILARGKRHLLMFDTERCFPQFRVKYIRT